MTRWPLSPLIPLLLLLGAFALAASRAGSVVPASGATGPFVETGSPWLKTTSPALLPSAFQRIQRPSFLPVT